MKYWRIWKILKSITLNYFEPKMVYKMKFDNI